MMMMYSADSLDKSFLKPWQMVLSDIIACLQLCLPETLVNSVNVYDAPVIDTGSCLGSKEHLELLKRSPRFIAMVQWVYSASLCLRDLLSPDQMTSLGIEREIAYIPP